MRTRTAFTVSSASGLSFAQFAALAAPVAALGLAINLGLLLLYYRLALGARPLEANVDLRHAHPLESSSGRRILV